MKQVTQRLRDGRIEVADVPPPVLTETGVLVDVRASLLSTGTERSKVETGRQNMLAKARSRPDQVSQVVEKLKRDGLRETVEAVRARLDQPSGLGYSAAGLVLAVGDRVSDLAPGDRVACAGGDYAQHAEIDHVPGNLCVPLPSGVDFVQGSFVAIGSIALHGVRQADAKLGERVGVIGLGLVGQLVGRLLRAAGCTVIGVDLADELVERALTRGGADEGFARSALESGIPASAANCDAVIITAATKSDDPVELAARLSRDRGRVVVLGDVGMRLPRAPYYEKEIEVRLSRSYGPGRYDRSYEERGLDYPIGYVRWTERRNMAAFLDLVASGRVEVDSLVTQRISIDEAETAYERLLLSVEPSLGIVLTYEPSDLPEQEAEGEIQRAQRAKSVAGASAKAGDPLATGVIGAGSFAQRILIPGLVSAGFSLKAIASRSGLSARSGAERFDFGRADTPDGVLDDPEIGLVVIATRHATHASLAQRALETGKAAFVEKPPCLTMDELRRLKDASARSRRPIAVGFNRRHAPLAEGLRKHVAGTGEPVQIIYRINTGPLPPDHWLDDVEEGGGRLLGEGCHFIDFACWLMGRLPERVSCLMRPPSGEPVVAARDFTVIMDFGDQSLATVVYETAGGSGLAKERIEAHAGARSAVLDDFERLTLYEGRKKGQARGPSGKGHREQFKRLAELLAGTGQPSSPDPLDTMAATFAALRSAETGAVVVPGSLLSP
jgi:predicted dehydrogenase/threonine dehydrogenase-like Zn-dependent dehydrogenase